MEAEIIIELTLIMDTGEVTSELVLSQAKKDRSATIMKDYARKPKEQWEFELINKMRHSIETYQNTSKQNISLQKQSKQ